MGFSWKIFVSGNGLLTPRPDPLEQPVVIITGNTEVRCGNAVGTWEDFDVIFVSILIIFSPTENSKMAGWKITIFFLGDTWDLLLLAIFCGFYHGKSPSN